jgi:hypothetical protein
MGHPDNGRIQAFIDGEAGQKEAAETKVHLEGCKECRAEEEILRASSRAVSDALGLLDTHPSLKEAKDRFRKKQRSGRGPIRRFLTPLPRAASIALLLTGAAVSALPGSPVRRWVVRGWEIVRPASPTIPVTGVGEAEGQRTESLQGSIPETGAGLPVLEQGVEISLQDLPPEAELQVLWIDGTEAWVYAGEGTRFTLLNARLEVAGPPGAVRVELPRGPGDVLLRLDGKVLLRKTGDDVEIVGLVKESTPDQIVFDSSRR